MTLPLYLLALAAGPLASIVYWVGFSWRPPSDAKSWVKALPLGILFCWLLVFEAEIGESVIPFVVLFAWAEDVLLSRPGRRAQVAGIGAFGLAHVALIAVFAERGLAFEAIRLPVVIFVLGGAAVFALWIWPRTGALRWPVLGYLCVIVAMALTGAAIDHPDHRVNEAILLAIFLFMLSDMLISIEFFVLHPGSRWRVPVALAIWPLYYVATVLFVAASVG